VTAVICTDAVRTVHLGRPDGQQCDRIWKLNCFFIFFICFLLCSIVSSSNSLFVFIGLQHSASTLLSLICFQEIPQNNVDSLKGTHFS